VRGTSIKKASLPQSGSALAQQEEKVGEVTVVTWWGPLCPGLFGGPGPSQLPLETADRNWG
jgi:hypothetical protein